MNIKVKKEGDRYLAWIEGEESLTRAYGDSYASALGSLIGFYPSRFGIEQITEVDPTSRS